MFSAGEYKELISEGVDAAMVALTECAYRVLFEAGTPAQKGVQLIPFPYDKMASMLSLDITDCRNEDGSLNNSKMIRKLNESPCFRAIDQKVSDIVDAGLKASGIGYRAPNGTIEYVYPEVRRNNDLQNTIENIKTVMMGRIGEIIAARFPESPSTSDDAVEYVNRIDANVAGRRLGLSVLNRFQNLISNRALSASDTVNPNDEKFDNSIVSPLPKNIAGEGASCIATNSDGSEWWDIPAIGTVDGKPKNAKSKVAWLIMNDYGNRRTKQITDESQTDGYAEVWTDTDGNTLARVTFGSAQGSRRVSDYVQAFSSVLTLGEAGYFNDISHQCDIYYKSYNGTEHTGWPGFVKDVRRVCTYNENKSIKFLLYCRLAKILTKNDYYGKISHSTTRRIVNLGGELFEDNELESESTVLTSLAILVECLEAKAIDIDDLKDFVNNGVTYDDAESLLDARMKSIVQEISGDEPGTLFDALLAYPDETLYALTDGKDSDTISARHKIGHTVGLSGSNLKTESARRLNNPEYQVALIKNTSIGYFVDLLNDMSKKMGEYVSISDDAIELIYDMGSPSVEYGTAVAIINYFSSWIANLSTQTKLSPQFLADSDNEPKHYDAALAKRIIDDCRRVVTPRLQEIAYKETCDSNGNATDETENLVHEVGVLITRVRGLQVWPKLQWLSQGGNDYNPLYRKSIDAKNLVRMIRYCADSGVINQNELIYVFTTYADSSEVLYDVEKNTVWGRRLKDVFRNIVDSDFQNRYLLVKDKNDKIQYIKAYIEPNKDKFALCEDDGFNMYYAMIRLYTTLFTEDEVLATKMFLDRKSGIFKCTKNELKDVPVGNDGKTMKKMVTIPLDIVRLKLLQVYEESPLKKENDKSDIALIGICFAGHRIIAMPLFGKFVDDNNIRDHVLGSLFSVSNRYDKDVEPGKRVIEPEDLATFMETHSDAMLTQIDKIPLDIARELCQKYITPEKLQKMSSTSEGLLMLIRLSARAGWELFSRQFIRANEMNINKLIDTLPPDEAAVLAKKVKALAGNTSQFAVSGGVATASKGQGSIQYHVANGLNWMDGFVKLNKGKTNTIRNATLFSMDEARQYIANGLPAGWRLPTLSEIEHLGNDPEVVAKKHLGFEPTGRMDENGEVIDTFGCYAWCTNGDDLTAYSVVNNAVEPDDFMVDTASESLAIKLVQ